MIELTNFEFIKNYLKIINYKNILDLYKNNKLKFLFNYIILH